MAGQGRSKGRSLSRAYTPPPPDVLRARARMGGYATAARHDSRKITENARRAFLDSFVDQVDPDRTLPESERLRRAEAARKLHYTRMAFRSAQVRRARAGKS